MRVINFRYGVNDKMRQLKTEGDEKKIAEILRKMIYNSTCSKRTDINYQNTGENIERHKFPKLVKRQVTKCR